MELSQGGEMALARALKRHQKEFPDIVEVVVCPSFPSLPLLCDLLAGTVIAVGAQHVHHEEKGAWTGGVSVSQIAPFSRYCLVGHSEVRAAFGQRDDDVERAVHLLLRYGLAPIVCLGETADERAADQTIEKISAQMDTLLRKMTRASLSKVVLAYEPIWAISAQAPTQLPEPGEVSGVMLLMRKLIAERFDRDTAQRVRLVYGGSVKSETAGLYAREPGVNGLLVGAASLEPRKFLAIVNAVGDAVSAA